MRLLLVLFFFLLSCTTQPITPVWEAKTYDGNIDCNAKEDILEHYYTAHDVSIILRDWHLKNPNRVINKMEVEKSEDNNIIYALYLTHSDIEKCKGEVYNDTNNK